MRVRVHVVRALVRRDFLAWFRHPSGYVFITLFVFLGAMAAFWQDRFFARNLANLDALHAVMPLLLLFFVPAVTMGLWAEERRQGTDELLLTLPVRDAELVLGKYLGALAIFTVALGFSLSNVVVLELLGEPDLGLLAATLLGHWLLGAALIGAGMTGSLLASSATVGFILGAVLCALVVFVHSIGAALGGRIGDALALAGPRPLFDAFGTGVVPVAGVVLFVGIAILGGTVNVALLRLRRHGRGTLAVHDAVRVAAVVVAVGSLAVLADRFSVRPDLTEEGLHSLSPETERLIAEVPADRPVYVQAFVSPEVPREHVATRTDLLNLLRRVDRLGGDRVLVNVHETERWSDSAREAQEKFGIAPRPVFSVEEGRGTTEEIFLGFAVTSGLNEVVVPFLHPGIPVEYELVRSIRTAAQAERRRVGVLRTIADITGGFDFQRMTSKPEWPIVTELRKQYEVVPVAPGEDYPADLDVLVVVLGSSLTQPEIDRLRTAALSGLPVLLLDDPLPLERPDLAPGEPRPRAGGGGPFGGGGPPPEPKGDFVGLLADLGLEWPIDEVVWDGSNPHPQYRELPPEFVFVAAAGHPAAFHATDPIASGLQEAVLLFPGHVLPHPAAGLAFTPLLRTTTLSGVLPAETVLTRTFMGPGGLNPRRPHRTTAGDHVLAARVQGTLPAGEDGRERRVHAVFVADVDMVSQQFFALRQQGVEDLEFDNVTFLLNAVDVLAGDESFVALRKRRRTHRTLEAVEAETRVHTERRLERTRAAEDEADRRMQLAQAALDAKVDAVRARDDLDERTRTIMVATLQEAEQRKLTVAERRIEDDKQRAIEISQAESESAVRAIQRRIQWLAALLPPIPALLLAAWVFRRRRDRERRGTPEERRTEVAA